MDLGDDVAGAVGQVVPGEAQDDPARPDEGVALAPVGAEPFHGDAGAGEGEVDLPGAERNTHLPARDGRRPQEAEQGAFGPGVGTVGGGDEQGGDPGPAAGAHVAAVGAVELVEPHVLLQGAIEEHGAVRHGDRGSSAVSGRPVSRRRCTLARSTGSRSRRRTRTPG
ncbi:MAG TPA: hypothetical protein VD903_16785 [Pseudonocardia sp.]|nr:hypothetical protein [Pseudonocardia sp.]